jgi:phosphoglycolate phosphatase
MKKLVLFDIDGTLIDSGEAGSRALERAFYELFSVRNAFEEIIMAGKTDIQIIKEGLSLHRLPSRDGILPSIVTRYVENLKVEINNKRKHIKPGVVELLDALSATEGCSLGLLTGNISHGARIKLGALSLYEYFRLGAYGDDHEDRNELLPIAVKKFKMLTTVDLHYQDCIVIGDTPRDVACSKPFGATSIAVSTGAYSYDALLETGADYVLTDLSHAMEMIPEFGTNAVSPASGLPPRK